ncbi:hypothetical protein KI387_011826, partial [Taxus chinensis]
GLGGGRRVSVNTMGKYCNTLHVSVAQAKGMTLVKHSLALNMTYGQVADNLPPPSAVAQLVHITQISK